jgi:N-hydroxyarylamine O-acetyltransferase
VFDVDGYLRRLGLAHPGAPTVEALTALHRVQVERIAYNTIDIHLGRATTVDPYDSARRVVATGRGGYCFHLNGGLSVLLSALGFDVRWHRGGVSDGSEPDPLHPFANHLALTVHGLPTPDSPDGVWFVDAGLGDALYDPIPLATSPARQGPFWFELGPSPVLAGGWRFRHDPAGSFRAMDFESRLATPEDFAASHAHLSTSPESGFVRWISVQRRDASGVDKLLSCTLRRIDGSGQHDRTLETASEWFAALADIFGLTLDDVDSAARQALWRKAWAAQEEWQESQ